VERVIVMAAPPPRLVPRPIGAAQSQRSSDRSACSRT
jgi:hypothetical protein